MGFGTIATHIILFIALVTVAGAFVAYLNVYAQDAQTSLRAVKDRMVDELKTDVTITSLAFSNASDPHTTTAYVKNTGKTKLELDSTDIYVDGERIERSSRNISIEADTQVGNSLIWDPTEVVKVLAFKNISTGIHTFRVATSNGVTAEDSFSN